jgi:hypothetical protein
MNQPVGKRESLTFSSDIVVYSKVEILSISHLVLQDDLPLEIKDGDVGTIESHSGLVAARTPSVEDCRHGDKI